MSRYFFIEKLAKLLDQETNRAENNQVNNLAPGTAQFKKQKPVISWSKDGEAFCIMDPERFTTEILPRVFRQSKIQSFVRQLNFYGFSKVKVTRVEKDVQEFKHPMFMRGHPQKLSEIRRKKVSSAHQLLDQDHIKSSIKSLLNEKFEKRDKDQVPSGQSGSSQLKDSGNAKMDSDSKPVPTVFPSLLNLDRSFMVSLSSLNSFDDFKRIRGKRNNLLLHDSEPSKSEKLYYKLNEYFEVSKTISETVRVHLDALNRELPLKKSKGVKNYISIIRKSLNVLLYQSQMSASTSASLCRMTINTLKEIPTDKPMAIQQPSILQMASISNFIL